MRNIAKALGKYQAEHTAVPPYWADAYFLSWLTTPVAYVSDIDNPYEKSLGPRSYRYGRYHENLLIYTGGPDKDWDIDTSTWTVPNPSLAFDITTSSGLNLLKCTYDPTNGTTSSGDVWRPVEIDEKVLKREKEDMMRRYDPTNGIVHNGPFHRRF